MALVLLEGLQQVNLAAEDKEGWIETALFLNGGL